MRNVLSSTQGRSQDLVSGGGAPISGGPDPLFFASDPKSQGSPLMYFWLPPDFGGGGPGPPAPPGYALGSTTNSYNFNADYVPPVGRFVDGPCSAASANHPPGSPQTPTNPGKLKTSAQPAECHCELPQRNAN